jgi:hypothetical protein
VHGRVLLANRLHRGHPITSGAQVCMGMRELTEFEPEFARWDIKTQVSERMPRHCKADADE